jgi:CRP-like cAMP-binding protein
MVSRTKLAQLCQSIYPVSYIKGVSLYKQGDPCDFLYFVRSGELKICMKTKIPEIKSEATKF